MKKIGLIILVAVLALGAMGAAYATWTQGFNVGGTVASGTYIVSIAKGSDVVTPTQTVATCTATVSPATGTGAALTISISNGFPGLTYTVPFTLTDSGTVPAKITGFTFADGVSTPAAYTSGTVTFNLSDGGSTPNTFTVNAQITGTDMVVGTVIPANSGTPLAGTLIVTIPSALTTGTEAVHNGSFNFVVNTAQQY